jgi:hypothetical protein
MAVIQDGHTRLEFLVCGVLEAWFYVELGNTIEYYADATGTGVGRGECRGGRP